MVNALYACMGSNDPHQSIGKPNCVHAFLMLFEVMAANADAFRDSRWRTSGRMHHVAMINDIHRAAENAE